MYTPSTLFTCETHVYPMSREVYCPPSPPALLTARYLKMSVRQVETQIFPPEVFLGEEFTLREVDHAQADMEDNKAVVKVIMTVP